MTIAEVSRKYELSPDTLRYYERVGLIPGVGRNKSGVRNYTDEDCRWVEFAKCMRGAGLSVEVLIEYLSLFAQGESTVAARKNLLVGRIDGMQSTLRRLDDKIARYEQRVAVREQGLLRTKTGTGGRNDL